MSEHDDHLEVRLVWAPDQNLQTIYANHFFITHAGDEFYLTFGELIPPVIQNESVAELREKIGDSLEILPLVRLAIAPDAMLRIAEAIRSNVTTYISRTSNEEAEQ